MAIEHTLAMIKPDAVSRRLVGEVVRRAQSAGLNPVALKMLQLSQSQARAFYAVHRERPFYDSLVAFMTEGPIVAMLLEGEDGIRAWRTCMGATDPAEADAGSIRGDLGSSKERNCTHGSDSAENARIEAAFFFSSIDTVSGPAAA